jgi:CRP-like cAMP-binding protein
MLAQNGRLRATRRSWRRNGVGSLPGMSSSAAPRLAEVVSLTTDLPERTVGDGEVLVGEGDTGADQLFVLVDGTLLVVKGDTPITAISEAGSVVGEMSTLLDIEHSATVRAVGEASVRVVDDPLGFLRDNPDMALAVARLLAKRLTTVTSYLADIKSQFADRADHLGLVDEVLDALVHDQGEDAQPGSARDPDPHY